MLYTEVRIKFSARSEAKLALVEPLIEPPIERSRDVVEMKVRLNRNHPAKRLTHHQPIAFLENFCTFTEPILK